MLNFSHSIRPCIRPSNKEILTALTADRNWTTSAERDKTHSPRILLSFDCGYQSRAHKVRGQQVSQFPHAERSHYEAAERCRLNESPCRDLEGRCLTRHAVMDFICLNHTHRPQWKIQRLEILLKTTTCACAFGFHANLTYCLTYMRKWAG